MTFSQFCESHGLIINHIVSNGRWQRVPTTLHPKSSNGAYIFDGLSGACQNWATMDKPIAFRSDDLPSYIDKKKNAEDRRKAELEKVSLQQAAARKAAFILKNSELSTHPYLMRKGFSETKGFVHDGKLAIPMRKGNSLVGLQMIADDGQKRFLYGQQTSYASHIIGRGEVNVLCEGYATGLSAQQALRLSGMRYTIHVCFSAGNMLKIAKGLSAGIVLADNDESETGLRTAEEIGWPYWMSPRVGEDFNDAFTTINRMRLSQELKKLLIKVK